jgi:hypothetical protein
VTDQPSKYGVDPELLAFAVQVGQRSGCQLVTVDEALRLARGGAEQAS